MHPTSLNDESAAPVVLLLPQSYWATIRKQPVFLYWQFRVQPRRQEGPKTIGSCNCFGASILLILDTLYCRNRASNRHASILRIPGEVVSRCFGIWGKMQRRSPHNPKFSPKTHIGVKISVLDETLQRDGAFWPTKALIKAVLPYSTLLQVFCCRFE